MLTESPFNSTLFEGRTFLITGATGHLGKPIAVALSELGATTLVASRTPAKSAALAQEIGARNGRCDPLAFNVGEPSECRSAIAKLESRFAQLDGIVNCAYGGNAGTISSSRDCDFDLAWRQILAGPFALIQAALPLLKGAANGPHGQASIVNIASMYAHVSPDPRIYGDSGKNNPPYYGAAKAALLQLTRYLSVHLGPDQIRVNSVSPGPFPPASIEQTDPAFHANLCGKTVLGRIGRAEELVGPVLFLLSDSASYVSGADLAVDGGWTAW